MHPTLEAIFSSSKPDEQAFIAFNRKVKRIDYQGGEHELEYDTPDTLKIRFVTMEEARQIGEFILDSCNTARRAEGTLVEVRLPGKFVGERSQDAEAESESSIDDGER